VERDGEVGKGKETMMDGCVRRMERKGNDDGWMCKENGTKKYIK
jgi:hypothetical protein